MCVEKQRSNILREHLPQLNVFFKTEITVLWSCVVDICISQGSAATDLRESGSFNSFPADLF